MNKEEIKILKEIYNDYLIKARYLHRNIDIKITRLKLNIISDSDNKVKYYKQIEKLEELLKNKKEMLIHELEKYWKSSYFDNFIKMEEQRRVELYKKQNIIMYKYLVVLFGLNYYKKLLCEENIDGNLDVKIEFL
jgi:hypothetical protein